MKYRRAWNHHTDLWSGWEWDDGTRPSRFTPWPTIAFLVAMAWTVWGLSRGLSAWVMIPGFYFSLYLIDYWETVMDTPKP